MQNVGKLAGKTIYISGASRGIGKAIALKCARDGANIVIAAKTAEPHPKLPGTIYTAAKEIEEAGGKCLPCIVDIRHEDQVTASVEKAVKEFGGIDILVNNASAIQLTGTLDTSMKAFDLMNSINARGTYLCSKVCLPHLKMAANPHILNLSPPLNMKARWFKNHVAYTMAKYGMSQCALGMAEEFREDGVAVNTLWPRTAIFTAAMEMLGGGASIKPQCRKPEIVADAAYYILTRDSRSFTGNFCIDEEVLKDGGVSDFDQYRYNKEGKLMVDFFLDDYEEPSPASETAEEETSTQTSGGSPEQIEKTFAVIRGMLNDDLVKSVGGVYHFDLRDGDLWYLDLKNDSGSAGKGSAPAGDADSTLSLSSGDFVKMFAGKLSPTTAFMLGKLKIKGNMGLAMKLEKLLKKMSTAAKL